MESNEQKLGRANESQVTAFTLALQERNVDTTDSNDIAYQASFLPIGEEGEFAGYGHAVRVERKEDGLHIINVINISETE